MIESMEQVHMTDAEVANDFPSVLQKLQDGIEVVVEHDNQPVAVIRPPKFQGRPIDECIATLEASGSHATLDDEFSQDLEAIINRHREPLNPPLWYGSHQ
jgi:antitoxin (DNA-binding transcriptional repressor) of toxin-antitoxin stability system